MTAYEFLDSLEMEAGREKTTILQADFARLMDAASKLSVLEKAYNSVDAFEFGIVVKAIFGAKQEEDGNND